MRIALWHTSLPDPARKPGGVEVAVHRLANALAARGDDTVAVYSLGLAPADARYEHHGLFAGRPRLFSQVGRMVALPLLLNTVDFSRHDVLHLHGDDWFFLHRRLPTVRTLHGSALREAQAAASRRRRALQYAVFPLEKLAARRATLPLAVGPDTAGIYGADHLVDNGVDLGLFSPGRKAARPTVLFVGGWGARKRGWFAHRVFTTYVRARVPEAELVMVSDECEPAAGVRYVPYPTDAELARLYREAWVFAYPSRYEGFGMAYVEAMASGTAIVTSPNHGASYVLDGGYGLVAGDEQFGASVVQLLEQAQRRRELEAAGLRRARRFSWSAVADQHRELYEQAVASWANPVGPGAGRRLRTAPSAPITGG